MVFPIQWRAKFETVNGFDRIRDSDITAFNEKLKDLEKLRQIELEINNEIISVDMKSGEITIDGNPVNIVLPEGFDPKEHKLRWIAFRRIEKRIFGGKRGKEVKGYGIGWQTTAGGENIKRIAFFKMERSILLEGVKENA